jgi:hypothetical protein
MVNTLMGQTIAAELEAMVDEHLSLDEAMDYLGRLG